MLGQLAMHITFTGQTQAFLSNYLSNFAAFPFYFPSFFLSFLSSIMLMDLLERMMNPLLLGVGFVLVIGITDCSCFTFSCFVGKKAFDLKIKEDNFFFWKKVAFQCYSLVSGFQETEERSNVGCATRNLSGQF